MLLNMNRRLSCAAVCCLLLICLFAGCECTHTDVLQPEPEPEYPVARLGPDLTSRVGSYVILDGSASTPGKNRELTKYEWGQLPDNPMERFLISGLRDSTNLTGFEEPGFYRYTLSIRNDAGVLSEPDTVAVEVPPRENMLFEDPALEVHVRYWSKYPEGELTDNFLMSVDSVDNARIITQDVTSLAGIERCKNLRWLGMGFGPLTDLSPLRGLTNLEHLNLTQCHTITDISPLWRLNKLKSLELTSNKISDISPLLGMSQIVQLYLSHNIINNISSLQLMDKLEVLHITESSISDISVLADKDSLRVLFLMAGNISDISALANKKKMEYMILDLNNISDISPIRDSINLAVLHMANNKIEDISALQDMVHLSRLILWNNNITDIKPLVDNSGIGQGDIVSLSGNPLNELSINTYIPQLQARGVDVTY